MGQHVEFTLISYAAARARFYYHTERGYISDIRELKSHNRAYLYNAPHRVEGQPRTLPYLKINCPAITPDQPCWGIDLNVGLKRKQYKHPLFLFDLIHLLVHRRPPPGPIMWQPYENYWYHYEYGQGRAGHPHLRYLHWFQNKCPFVTWEARYQRWRARITVSKSEVQNPRAFYEHHMKYGKRPRSQKPYETLSKTYNAWKFTDALADLQEFRYHQGINPDEDPYASVLTGIPYLPRPVNRITGERREETPREAMLAGSTGITTRARPDANDIVADQLPDPSSTDYLDQILKPTNDDTVPEEDL